MQSFYLQLGDRKFTIKPLDNRSFAVIEAGTTIGSLQPVPGDRILEWRSDDMSDQRLVKKLGELIEGNFQGKSML